MESSQAIIRSFNPGSALPAVTSLFHKSVDDDIWQTWYYPAHGKTWINRNNDERLASAVHVRHAWENMLRDSGIQYNFLCYVDVIQKGIPADYKVLILPACLCLSDAEARQIKAFAERGGTVIADYLPGLWDQHGKGRAGGGALDGLFGMRHEAAMRSTDLFGGRNLWVEVDQDANFSWKTHEEFLTNHNTCIRDAGGYHKAVRTMPVERVEAAGRGRAVLMNLSPQWYNAYRVAGAVAAQKRDVFMRRITAAGVTPRVRIQGGAEAVHGYEITCWSKPATGTTGTRTLVFVCFNPETTGDSMGGGNSEGLKSATIPIQLKFAQPVKDVRNERTGEALGQGGVFELSWKQNEGVVLSFASAP
jgi:hypothetical protein